MPKSSKNKRDEVAYRLERAILEGHLKPGARLPAEIKIARALGVSQASVREALLDLENKGLIVGYQNRSSYVIELKTEDLMHIYQVRRELEPLACSLAATALTRETADALQSCLETMREAAAHKDFRAFSEADLNFHRTIWKAQPNRPLEKLLLALCQPMFAYDLVLRYSNADIHYERILQQHGLLLAALRTREPDRVARLTRRLISRWTRQDIADFDRLPLHDREDKGSKEEALELLQILSEGAEKP